MLQLNLAQAALVAWVHYYTDAYDLAIFILESVALGSLLLLPNVSSIIIWMLSREPIIGEKTTLHSGKLVSIGSSLCFILSYSLGLGLLALPYGFLTSDQEGLVVVVMVLSIVFSTLCTNALRVSFNILAYGCDYAILKPLVSHRAVQIIQDVDTVA
jgi:hypothetical protein